MKRPMQPRFRLQVEALEARAVPALFTAATVAELIADINAANATPEADTIELVPGTTFTLTEANNTSDTGANGLPTIAAAGGPLAIIGYHDVIERSSAANTGDFRLLHVAEGASLTLDQVTLQGGLATWGFLGATGGAILNEGELILHGVTVRNNTARGSDGLEFWGSVFDGGSATGGGISSSGNLILDGCTISNNSAIGGNGIAKKKPEKNAGGVLEQIPTGHPASDGGDAFGGGIYIAGGTATITNTTIANNTTKAGSGGSGGGSNGSASGGGLFIAPGADVSLDAFTVSHFKKNSNGNITGAYVGI